jgi:integrase
VEAYEKDHYDQWAPGTQSAWRAHRTHFRELEGHVLVSMTTDFWRSWLREKSTDRNWDNRTYNGIRSRLYSIYRHAIPDLISSNPIEGLKRRRVAPKAVLIYSVEQIQALLDCAWKHDREMVPFFAIAVFAGLRPQSELERLEWEDVNFEEGWIRVGANYDNKTQTRRYVPIESNLLAWLEPWKSASGLVVPETNLTKRRRWITRGKYLAPPRTPEGDWAEVAPYGDHVRDITRHTYGSYMDAIYRDRNKLKEWMGHTSFKTYDQHYRNARTEEQGKAFQAILPPVADQKDAESS